MRAREVFLVAAREVESARKNRWFLFSTASFLVLSLALALLGLAGSQRVGLAGYDRTTAALLNLVLLFVPLCTLSLGGLGIAGELEDGSLGMLLAQPLTRGEAYVGKLLGLFFAVAASILVGFGTTGVLVGLSGGGGDARAFLVLLGVVLLLVAATLSLGALLSVALGSRARVIGAAFATWLGLVYVSDLGAIGLTIARHLDPAQVFALALVNPVEQARVLGTLALSHRLDALGPAGVWGLDHFGTAGLAALLAVTLAVTAIGLSAVGNALFRRTIVS
jgi:ABC-type transport system involved in multi-copper enzyme maturation permease subunit